MPNWCNNIITISKPHIGEALKQFFTDSELDFQKIIPMPDTISDWYQWNIQNWHTKWGASGTEILSEDDKSIRFFFRTAWSPPIPVFERLSELLDAELHITSK